jgi:hypothetical protein
MLFGLPRQVYQEFQQALQKLRILATKANPDPIALRSRFSELQQFFQMQITELDLDEFAEATQAKVRSYRTEINKQLRLLGLDVMFLQTARQSTTTQRRQAQMVDRIDTLVRYCDVLLSEE